MLQSGGSVLEEMEVFLKTRYPGDMLMPLRSSSCKEPKYRHKGQAWSWGAYDEFKAREPGHSEYGLLLRALCALDFDDEKQAMEFEESYEELKRAPMERTRKGRHYLFERPSWADGESYYDGARQRGADVKVDFKTVCSTGTSGLLVVSPSEGKEWVRAPWSCEPFPISRSLLEAVARSHHRVGGSRTRMESQGSQESSGDATEKLLNMLSKTRWDDRCQWLTIATALKNEHGSRYKTLFKRLSRISAKYDEAEAEKLWATVARGDYEGPRVSMRTLERWASEDDPWSYAEYRATVIPEYVLTNWEKEDRGLAVIASRLLKEEVKVTSSTSKRTVYYFEGSECRWYEGSAESLHRVITKALEVTLRDVETYYALQARAERDEVKRRQYDEKRAQAGKAMKYVWKHTGISNVTQELLQYCVDREFEQTLDSQVHLLGVGNGVVDLRTGALRARKPEDLILRVVPVDYDKDADYGAWTAALRAAMAGDEEMVSFLQLLLGYAITGETAEEVFVILTGSGRNFKGVLTQTLERLLGDFFASMNTGLICERQISNVDAERGKLLGKRVIVFNELKPDEKLKTDEVKLLSGGDGIPTRPLYKEPMTLVPRHLAILSTNHMPGLNGDVSAAMMERLLVIHFPVTFTDLLPGEAETPYRRRADKTLKTALQASLPGVLLWLVQGSVRWYAGRQTASLRARAPAKVTEFSRAYFEEQDVLGEFLSSECVMEPDARVPSRALVRRYNAYVNQEYSSNARGLVKDEKGMARAMAAKGFARAKARLPGHPQGMCYLGVALRDPVVNAD
jgi:P4 family phage/plasmid primase-like protien